MRACHDLSHNFFCGPIIIDMLIGRSFKIDYYDGNFFVSLLSLALDTVDTLLIRTPIVVNDRAAFLLLHSYINY